MEEKLRALFDFQRFAQEETLAALIRETEARYGAAAPLPLSDEWLEDVAAAGAPAHGVAQRPAGPLPDGEWNGDRHKN